ncbi:MAG: cytochrome c biogenesis protein CcsA [Verrucomicrobia bacterium]|nr:cytochrome c biogenesis protein CcsA [Verrucomicrobiota bacterium]
MTDRPFFLLAVALYGASTVYSVFLWRHGFRQANRVNYALLASAFVLHSIAMVRRGFSLERCPVNNLYEATTFLLWTIVAAYLVLGAWQRLRFLSAFASPVLFAVGVFALMPALDPPHGPKPDFGGGWISLHAALVLLAYGAFGLGSAAAAMYLTQEHDLKFHKMRAIVSLMPPIERMEVIMGRLLFAGFTLLTVGLAAAVKLPKGVPVLTDAKVLWSVLVWAIYLALVVWRIRYTQGGRRFAWAVVASFIFVLLTFWGTNLMSELHR